MSVNPVASVNYAAEAYSTSNVNQSGKTSASGGVNGTGECRTCQERKYRCGDGTPENVSAGTSSAQVMTHEREHLVEQAAKAGRKDMEVVDTNIRIEYDRCPECGRMYASGGEAKSTMIKKSDQKPEGLGVNLDLTA